MSSMLHYIIRTAFRRRIGGEEEDHFYSDYSLFLGVSKNRVYDTTSK
jgi:hypothetical protein